MTKTMTTAEYLETLATAFNLRGQDRPTRKDLIARIREECTGAVKAGVLPAGAKVSVRQAPVGYTSSLRVEIVEWVGAVFCDEYVTACMEAFAAGACKPSWTGRCRPFTDELSAAIRALETIAAPHNYDHSDSMTDHFDVGYYLTVDARKVEIAAMTGLRAEMSPAFAELRGRAMEAAKAIGPAAVKSLCGRAGIENAGQWACERVIKLAARANGRPVAYDKRLGWQVAA